MALTNTDGLYLKVEGINYKSNTIFVRIYLNNAHRLSGDTDYLKCKQKNIDIPDGLVYTNPATDNNINQVIKKNIYLVLKQIQPYATWSDC
jgi:hypothetical protein